MFGRGYIRPQVARPSMVRVGHAVGAVVLVLLAGCMGPQGGNDAEVALEEPNGGAGDVASPGATERTGTIEGSVRSSTGELLPDANVSLFLDGARGAIAAALSEEATFTLADVPVGAHRLEASLLGYDTAVAPVTVLEATAAKVELVLKPLETAAGFNVSVELKGRITCYVGGYEAHVDCRAVGGSAGKEQRDSFPLLFGSNATPPVSGPVTGLLVEATWNEPNAAETWGPNPPFGMTMLVGDPLDGNRFRQVDGQRGWRDPPPRLLVDSEYLEPWGFAAGGEMVFSMRPTSPQVVSPAPHESAAFDIEFTALATVFYDAPADPCWSPMKAAKIPCA